MSDNVSTAGGANATLPASTAIATDQLSDGSHAQKIKLIDGTADGTTGLIVTAAGAAKVDGSAVVQPVSGTFYQATQPVSIVSVPSHAVTNAGTFAVQVASGTVTAVTDITNAVKVTDNSGSLTVDAPVGTPVFVRLSDGSSAIATLPVSLASVPSHAVTNAGTFAVQNTPAVAASATLANVASSASNVTIIASNASRKGAIVQNDSTQVLYLKFGATATSSSYTVKMSAGDYYEFPQPVYTGIVDGIWASSNGSARVTEIA